MKEIIYDFGGFNQKLFYIINKFAANAGLEEASKYVSRAFDIENFALYYIIALFAGYFYLKKNSKVLSAYYDFMVKLGASYATFGLTYALLKFTINMPRPFCSLPNHTFHTILNTDLERCLSSFPSSHAGLAILLTLNLWNYINNFSKIFMIILALTVAISRISLAMHYPADILYGAIISYFVYLVSGYIYGLFEHNIIKWVKNRLL